jgi:hypothetical protein
MEDMLGCAGKTKSSRTQVGPNIHQQGAVSSTLTGVVSQGTRGNLVVLHGQACFENVVRSAGRRGLGGHGRGEKGNSKYDGLHHGVCGRGSLKGVEERNYGVKPLGDEIDRFGWRRR